MEAFIIEDFEENEEWYALYNEKTKKFKAPEHKYNVEVDDVDAADRYEFAHDAIAAATKFKDFTAIKIMRVGDKLVVREIILDDYKDWLLDRFMSDVSECLSMDANEDDIPTENWYTELSYPKEWQEAALKVLKYYKDAFRGFLS